MVALIALALGLVVIVVGQGFSTVGAVRALEDAALGVIVMFDMEYSATITGNDLKGCATIQDVFKLLEKKG